MTQRKENERIRKIIIILSVFVFVMFVIVLFLSWKVFFISKNSSNNKEKVISVEEDLDPGQKVAIEDVDFEENESKDIDYNSLTADEIIKMVSKHMLLAKGEAIVATVINADGLRAENNEIFKYAKNGDKLIFYKLGVIVYDPALDNSN
jgi:uncharacterized membrane protein YvbJ